MTQNEKDLLLKDLCARLPYGVKGLVTFNGNIFMTQPQVEVRTIDGKLYDRFAEFQDSWYDNVTIKPYLFPLSDIVKEAIIVEGNRHIATNIDWLNANHLDYRGLIEKSLALDATNLGIYE
mgnify:CR=1 FL=1